MKHLKSLLAVSAILLCATAIHAQVAKVYPTVLTGGTNNVAAASTNLYTNVTQVVSEFENVGVTLSAKADAACTGTVYTRWVKSMDGGTTYESTPTIALLCTLNGTTVVNVATNLSVAGATHIKLYDVWNTNATQAITNLTVKYNLKSPKYGARQATQ